MHACGPAKQREPLGIAGFCNSRAFPAHLMRLSNSHSLPARLARTGEPMHLLNFLPGTISALGLALVTGLAMPLPAQATEEILIPYERFTLDNGLTVIVHTDRKAPIVAVNVWYHVGSQGRASPARPVSPTCSST